MSELKTLKDFPRLAPCNEKGENTKSYSQFDDGVLINVDDLKQEAIKWVKEFEIELEPLPKFKNIGGTHLKEFFPKEVCEIVIGNVKIETTKRGQKDIQKILIAFIKHFFNITDKELK